MKKNILFLCTGNSCRSQMAQGYGRFFYKEKYDFYSAGTIKTSVNPWALKVMKNDGVDISSHQSNTVDELPIKKIDIVVTVCSDADEKCPYFPGAKVIHIGFDDPPRLTKDLSDTNDIELIYIRVRDEIKQMVFNLEDYINV